MNAYDFLKQYGTQEAERVALLAETNLAYFKQLASGHRRASVELAKKLVTASKGRMDLMALLLATKPLGPKTKRATSSSRATA